MNWIIKFWDWKHFKIHNFGLGVGVMAWSKKWSKNQKLNGMNLELSFWHHSIRLDELIVLVVMPIQSWGKSDIQIFWDMDFKFVLPIISIYIEGQTKLEVNWTQIDYFSLQKNTKMAMFQNPILPKCQSPKNLLLLHFPLICLKIPQSI